MELQKGDIVDLDITDVAFGGHGVGRVDNCVVFVPFTIPGETVRARVCRRKKRYYYAEPEEIVTPSPNRTEPFCPYFQTCGGCQYQHIAYEEQLRLLNKQLMDILVRLGGFPEDISMSNMISSPRRNHYRNRIDLHPRPENEYGFCVRGRPREIFPLHQCPLFELEDDFSQFPLRRTDELLVIRTHSGKPYCYFKDDHNIVRSEAYDLETFEPVGVDDVCFEIGDKTFVNHYSGFFQVNRWILRELIDTVTTLASPEPSDTLLDVYCGVGVFALALADKVDRVLGVEILPESIKYARRNAEAFACTNTEFTAAAGEVYLRELVDKQTHVDVCILDPPRNGLTNKVVSAVKKLRPGKLVYVSCGPATFARDARKFVDAGYELTKLQPLDLFPHTKHFELVARFNRETR